MEYDNTDTGVLFNNAEHKKTDKHPDYKGTINVLGKDFELAGWIKTGKQSGKKFLSLKVSPKREVQ